MLQLCEKSGLIETGGVLLGSYTKAHDCAVITEITAPPADSERFRFSFKRGTNGLRKKLKALWRKTGEFYLGEWHFHPNGAPIPSPTDDAGMQGIADSNNYKCPEPISIIIGGSFPDNWQIRAYIYRRKKSSIELHAINSKPSS